MAVLESIRKKSGLLIIVIGLAMVAFILGDLLNSGTSLFSSGNIVGKIDGQEIDYKVFSEKLHQLQDQNPTAPMKELVDVTWNNLEGEIIIGNELEDLGIIASDKDILELIKIDPQVRNIPAFKDSLGNFDPYKVENYRKQLRENPGQNKEAYNAWMNFENQIKNTAPNKIYNSLIAKGLYASYKEGEMEYKFNNNKIDAEYVYIPYEKISDSLISVSEEEMIEYVKENKQEETYQSKGSRDIQYVFLKVEPSEEDRNLVLSQIKELLVERKIYDDETKETIIEKGFKQVNNNLEFVLEHSDIAYDSKYYHSFENNEINKWIKTSKKGDVYGPYEEDEHFKITKLEDIKIIPDSVEARHILISFKDLGLSEKIQRGKDEAEKLADSLLRVIKSKKNSFKNIAKEFSDDKSNSENSGELGFFTYGKMVPEFNDFCFFNKKGDIKIVETNFGFHIIEILKQKNISRAYKLATVSKKIYTSEATDDNIDQKAIKISNKKYTSLEEFIAVTNNMNLKSKTVEGLQPLEYELQGLPGENRNVIQWSFNKKTNVGDVRMFDVDNGYLIAFLFGKEEKGSWNITEMNVNIKPILINKKKFEILEKELKNINLKDFKEIENKYSITKKSITSATFNNDFVAGIGSEPKLIGSLFGLKKKVISNIIEGNKGVFFAKVIDKIDADKLENYTGIRNQVQNKYLFKSYEFYIYQALKKKVNIEDNRANFY